MISAVNTDADVHATCQVISFKVPNDLHEAAKIHNYMETFLLMISSFLRLLKWTSGFMPDTR